MDEKVTLVKEHRHEHGLNRCCEALALSKGTSHYRRQREECFDEDEEALKEELHSVIVDHPGYGYRRLEPELEARTGRRINHKRLRRRRGKSVWRRPGPICSSPAGVGPVALTPTTCSPPGKEEHHNLLHSIIVHGHSGLAACGLQLWVFEGRRITRGTRRRTSPLPHLQQPGHLMGTVQADPRHHCDRHRRVISTCRMAGSHTARRST